MDFENGAFSNLRIETIGNKEIYITDRHQYVLPIWTAYSNENAASYVLVSIDYHPDTNPPFWQVLTLKATLDNREDDPAYFNRLLEKKIHSLDRYDIGKVIAAVEELNNDEHINTAMALGVLSDYHMLNCMDVHKYESGRHYLIDKKYFGLLEDGMFQSVNFELPPRPFILDIDLDYFMRTSDFDIKKDAYFAKLVEDAEIITVARSKKYFEYLKKEAFSIDACESLLLDCFRRYLEK
ncbi:MAG: UPF0489 family protein [Clostridia bacterium]|nr:UPF0489 family protein [Clostridia bacterium]